MRRIVIEIFPNVEHIRLHCNFEISRIHLSGGLGGDMNKTTDYSGNQAKPEVLELRKALYELPGIDGAPGIETYEVSLTKSPAFEWREIVPKAISLLEDFANSNYGEDTLSEYILKDSRPQYESVDDTFGFSHSRRKMHLPPVPDFGVPVRDPAAEEAKKRIERLKELGKMLREATGRSAREDGEDMDGDPTEAATEDKPEAEIN